jgi:YaiO family outer membrane protein
VLERRTILRGGAPLSLVPRLLEGLVLEQQGSMRSWWNGESHREMMRGLRHLGMALLLCATAGTATRAQPAAGAQSTLGQQQLPAAPRATPFTLEIGGFYSALDNGYTDWSGLDLRLSHTGTRASPFLGVSTQRRGRAVQENVGIGSYITLDRRTYAIVGVSSAPGGNAILHPRLRYDVSLLTDSRIVRGLVLAAGYTHLSFGGNATGRLSTGQIGSLGAIYYRGPLIVSGSARLNHDGVGGANTGSGEVGWQYGSQGRAWWGGRLSAGHEAYQLLAETPFDVRFTNVGAGGFYQRWLTRRTAATLRLDYEEKLTAYHRGALSLAYAVAF